MQCLQDHKHDYMEHNICDIHTLWQNKKEFVKHQSQTDQKTVKYQLIPKTGQLSITDQ